VVVGLKDWYQPAVEASSTAAAAAAAAAEDEAIAVHSIFYTVVNFTAHYKLFVKW